MFAWKKRIAEWRAVMAQKGVKVSIFALVRAVASGPVPPDVWRNRIRICLHCPVYDAETKACRKDVGYIVLGCSCYVPFLAFTAAPYSDTGGCWAREKVRTEGWPAYQFKSRLAKLAAVLRFIFP